MGIEIGRVLKEGNVLFNNALNTFYLRPLLTTAFVNQSWDTGCNEKYIYFQTYTRKFIVRFETGMTSFNTDFRITATCGPEGSTITVTTADIEADRDT